MNINAGICDDCGRYWTVTAGGLNDDEQCGECARKYPVSSKAKFVAVNEHGARIGEDHPKAKHSNGMIELALGLRDEGWGYKRISRAAKIPKRTVRDICNGRIRCQYPDRLKRVRIVDEDDG